MNQNKNFRYTHSDYIYMHAYDQNPVSISYKLHNHNNQLEILLFEHGNGEFRVEGTTYFPQENDILITQANEMHRMILKSNEPYERTVINIENNFFARNDCEQLKKIFLNRPLGANNLIHADEKIIDAFTRLKQYISDGGDNLSVVSRSVLTELLYILNKSDRSTQNSFYSENISKIIIFINENITEQLSLNEIADRFFISKYHLCHTFKKNTGFTVNKYIAYKRILLVQELCGQGCTLTEAAVNAGFGNYSNFYRIYVQETGKSPRELLKASK